MNDRLNKNAPGNVVIRELKAEDAKQRLGLAVIGFGLVILIVLALIALTPELGRLAAEAWGTGPALNAITVMYWVLGVAFVGSGLLALWRLNRYLNAKAGE